MGYSNEREGSTMISTENGHFRGKKLKKQPPAGVYRILKTP